MTTHNSVGAGITPQSVATADGPNLNQRLTLPRRRWKVEDIEAQVLQVGIAVPPASFLYSVVRDTLSR